MAAMMPAMQLPAPAFAPCMMAHWQSLDMMQPQPQPQLQHSAATSDTCFAAPPQLTPGPLAAPAVPQPLDASQWHAMRLQRLLDDVSRLHSQLTHLKREVWSAAAPAGTAADNFGGCSDADMPQLDAGGGDDDMCSSCGDDAADDELDHAVSHHAAAAPAPAASLSPAAPQHDLMAHQDSAITEMLQDALAAALHKATGGEACSADSCGTTSCPPAAALSAGSSGWGSQLHLAAAMEAELQDCLLQNQMLLGMA